MYNVHGSFVGQQTARGEQRQEFRNCGDCCSDWLYTTLQALAEESSIVSTSSMALECLHYTNFVSRFCVFCLSHVHSFLSLFLYIPRYIFWWAVAPFYTKQKISYKISLLAIFFCCCCSCSTYALEFYEPGHDLVGSILAPGEKKNQQIITWTVCVNWHQLMSFANSILGSTHSSRTNKNTTTHLTRKVICNKSTLDTRPCPLFAVPLRR